MNLTLFKKHDLSAVLDAQTEKIRQEVENYTEEYLLNASETDLVAHLLSKYVADPPQLGDPFMLEPREVDVDVGRDPIYGSFPGYSSIVKGCCVDVRIPFKGDQLLFFCRPSSYMTGSPAASVDSGYVMLEYRNPGELNPEEVKKRFDRDFLCISTQLNHIKLQCDSYNSQLESAIRQMVSGRKSRLLKNRQAGASIGLPLLRRSGAPQTYSIPNVQRKPEIQRPVVTTKGYLPEPALDEKEYEHILSIIRSMVSVIERSPKEFHHIGEEGLRSHFLVQLNSQYQGRATGETFNYDGKTDILIRENDRNIFIAECKIWKGEAELAKAIDQLLGYLHWRDTKTALLIFNRNKSFSDVLAKIVPTIQAHACHKKLIKKVGETEWRFLFRNRDDSNRELQLAVMAFDVPKETA